MLENIARRMAKDDSLQAMREAYGNIAGVAAILVNLLICAGELIVGFLAGSIAIMSDAIHNVADAGGGVIALLSFKLAGRKADREHPYGHGRLEYLFSIGFSLLLWVLAIEIGKEAIERIWHPVEVEFSWLTVIIMLGAMGAKILLYVFQRKIAVKIDSSILKANALESLSDIWATFAILVGLSISPLVGLALDGYLGAVVSLMIARAGFHVFKESTSMLIGNEPSQERVQEIANFIKSYEGVMGVHDLMIHDYGPGNEFASIHVEVDATKDIIESHNLIDRIERDAKAALGLQLTIHMDPLIRNAETEKLFVKISKVVKAYNPEYSIHDLRAIESDSYINLVFDLVIPFTEKRSVEEVASAIATCLEAIDERYKASITVERNFTGITDIHDA